MVVGSSAAKGARSQILKEALGECLINENGEFYTRNSKLTANMYVFFVIFFGISSIIFIGLVLTLGHILSEEDIFYVRLGLISIPFSNSIFLVRAKAFVFDRWILTRDSIIVKKLFKTIEIPLYELQEMGMTMTPIERKGFVYVSSREYLIQIPYHQGMGALNFLMKLKVAANIPMIDEERLKKNVHAFKPITLKEDKKEYKRRKAMGMKVM